MSEATIYYFSGTGNSLAAARDVAERLGGRLVPIASVVSDESVRPNTDVVGLVFPVYFETHGGLPQIVKRFAAKLERLESRYVFALCTYGSASVAALSSLAGMIRSRGGVLASGFTVNMPENIYPDLARRRHQRMYDAWKDRVDAVCGHIEGRKPGEIHLPNLLVGRAYGLVRRVMPLALRPLRGVAVSQLQRIAGSSLKEYDELIPLVDRGFDVEETCNGCGVCAEVCPVDNIRMSGGRPSWTHHCEFCLACLHWCPQQAIRSRAVRSTLRYHHPEVTLPDMLWKG